jgi:hypothetical protein
MKFREKPIVIEAECYDGTNESAERIMNIGGTREIRNRPEGLYIETFEGIIRANIGDWIISGRQRRVVPVQARYFRCEI